MVKLSAFILGCTLSMWACLANATVTVCDDYYWYGDVGYQQPSQIWYTWLPNGSTMMVPYCHPIDSSGNVNGAPTLCSWYFLPGGSSVPVGTEAECGDSEGVYAAEPQTCSDGVQTEGEDGIDCGGPCGAACDAGKCPEGYAYDGSACRPSMQFSDDLGNCPPGTSRYAQTNVCYDSKYLVSENGGTCPEGTVADAGVCVPPPILYNSANDAPDYPALAQSPTDSTFESSSSSNTDSSSTTVSDNGDGTSTRITTGYSGSTSGGSGGSGGSSSGTTSTTTEIIDNATGDVISSTTESTGTDDNPLSNPDNYTVNDPTSDADGVGDRFGERVNSFLDTIKSVPIYSAFSFTVPSGGTSAHLLDLGSYGTFSIDFQDYSNVFSILGWALVFASLWISGKLIIANKG